MQYKVLSSELSFLQAAKNFQLKEAEHKSISEARGYVPMLTPQQAALAANSLHVSPITAESVTSSSSPLSTATSGARVSNGPTREASGESDSLTVKAEAVKTSKYKEERKSSPNPSQPPSRQKNRSEAILDRILSKKKTPPPTATPTTSAMVTTSSISLSSLAPPTVAMALSNMAPPTVVAPSLASSLLGSVGVASGLTPPTIVAAAANVIAAAGGGSLLGLPRPSISSTLPGQGAVLTTSAAPRRTTPPVVISEPNKSQE